MAWVITIAVLVVLVVLLFAPIESRVMLREDRGLVFSVHWLGVPFRFGGRKKSAKPKPQGPKKKKTRSSVTPSNLLRMGKAGWAVARAPGVRALVWRTTMRAVDALELVKAHATVSFGVGNPVLTGLLNGVFSAAKPRIELGDDNVRLRIVADFTRVRFHFDGEAIVRTRPFPWIVIALQVLCSSATWRARRAWKAAMRPVAASQTK